MATRLEIHPELFSKLEEETDAVNDVERSGNRVERIKFEDTAGAVEWRGEKHSVWDVIYQLREDPQWMEDKELEFRRVDFQAGQKAEPRFTWYAGVFALIGLLVMLQGGRQLFATGELGPVEIGHMANRFGLGLALLLDAADSYHRPSFGIKHRWTNRPDAATPSAIWNAKVAFLGISIVGLVLALFYLF